MASLKCVAHRENKCVAHRKRRVGKEGTDPIQSNPCALFGGAKILIKFLFWNRGRRTKTGEAPSICPAATGKHNRNIFY
jgi:hypothetical protein